MTPQLCRLRRWDTLVVWLGLLVLSAACGSGSSPQSAEPVASPPVASAEPAATLTAAPQALPSAASIPATARPAISFPPEAEAIDGGKYYGVFVSVKTSVDDPELTRVSSELEGLGYQGGVGEIDCTAGAREQLKLKSQGDYFAYSLYFATRQQAQQFVDAYEGPVVGTAFITANCLD